MTIVLPEDRANELLARARELAERAYAPYSRYSVGAAVLTASGEIVGGCNVENASYGLSICAERAAVFAARARGLADPREMPIVAIAIVAREVRAAGEARGANATPGGPAPWPCGACRQVLAEFAREDATILIGDEASVRVLRLGELLPHAFRFERES